MNDPKTAWPKCTIVYIPFSWLECYWISIKKLLALHLRLAGAFYVRGVDGDKLDIVNETFDKDLKAISDSLVLLSWNIFDQN